MVARTVEGRSRWPGRDPRERRDRAPPTEWETASVKVPARERVRALVPEKVTVPAKELDREPVQELARGRALGQVPALERQVPGMALLPEREPARVPVPSHRPGRSGWRRS